MENCFFWVDQNLNPAEKELATMSVICCECCAKYPGKFPGAWMWEGSKKGYGPFDYICDECSKVIYKKEWGEHEKNQTGI